MLRWTLAVGLAICDVRAFQERVKAVWWAPMY
jgi:hypothetical protein